MSLWLHVFGGYPSYVESGLGWRGTDHDAHMFVQTLKGKPINGYVVLRDRGGVKRQFTTEEPGNAFLLFGEWAAARLDAIGLDHGHLVPVPSSDCVEIGTDEKGRKLAASIADQTVGFVVLEALRWGKALQKSAEGGSRDPDILYENLRILPQPRPRDIVLVDDVVTTGGHLIACARALRSLGHRVEHAICAAQTVWEYPEQMFGISPRDLEA